VYTLYSDTFKIQNGGVKSLFEFP